MNGLITFDEIKDFFNNDIDGQFICWICEYSKRQQKSSADTHIKPTEVIIKIKNDSWQTNLARFKSINNFHALRQNSNLNAIGKRGKIVSKQLTFNHRTEYDLKLFKSEYDCREAYNELVNKHREDVKIWYDNYCKKLDELIENNV